MKTWLTHLVLLEKKYKQRKSESDDGRKAQELFSLPYDLRPETGSQKSTLKDYYNKMENK